MVQSEILGIILGNKIHDFLVFEDSPIEWICRGRSIGFGPGKDPLSNGPGNQAAVNGLCGTEKAKCSIAGCEIRIFALFRIEPEPKKWQTTAESLPDQQVIPVGTVDPGYAYALLDEWGDSAAEGEPGEIAVTSSGVALGYWSRGTIDASRFQTDPDDGDRRIYRLGDLGRRLPDGNVVVLGRRDRVMKINGQSVSPVEVEAVLNTLPGCAAAAVVAFGAPGSQKLAAFLAPDKDGRLAGDPAAWLADRLPSVMIPSRFEILEQLPLLPGGKLDTGALRMRAEAKGEQAAPNASDDPLVAEMSTLWADILGLPTAPTDVDFVALGGDSLMLIGLILEIETRYRRHLTVEHLDGNFTIQRLCEGLRQGEFMAAADTPLFPIQTRGAATPFFCVHALGRHTNYMVPLAAHMGVGRPVFGLRPPEDLALNRSIVGLASLYVDALLEQRPEGPFLLGGFSLGGTIAYEMGCLLQDAGRDVALVVLMDTGCDLWRPNWGDALQILGHSLVNLPGLAALHVRLLRPEKLPGRLRRLGRRLRGSPRVPDDVVDTDYFPAEELPYIQAHFAAKKVYKPRPRRLPMAVLPASVQGLRALAPDLSRGWSRVADVRRITPIPGMHSEIVAKASMPKLAAAVTASLDETGL